MRVLQQLIAGTAGDRLQWEMRRKRLATVTKNIKKEIGDKSEKSFSLESVQFRLSAPFHLSQGAHYPRILTLKQQEKAASHTHPGELQHLLLPALHAERAPHDDNSITPVHLLRLRPQHPAPRRRRRQRRRRGEGGEMPPMDTADEAF